MPVRRLFLSTLAACVVWLLPAHAEDRSVVVELYTSQGCSSCPPADAYLHKLAARDDVIALALHVDYWDYIGWKDSFGKAAWSDRQRGYAQSAGRTMVYTPQMIINGKDHVIGNRPKDVETLIARHLAAPEAVALSATREADRLRLRATPQGVTGGQMAVQLVRYRPKEEVKITRGENAGKTLSYANIVTDIEVIGTWTGQSPLELEATLAGESPAVVLIQKQPHGQIVAAVKVE